ncbi:cytochrome P450 [Dactylosporangium roseum]|nr:cytochrome P450 [Dactylosporangium roseum]
MEFSDVLDDPVAAYRRAREEAPVARLGPMWVVLRHAEARTVLTDPRFALSAASYQQRPDVPERYRPYLRTMQEMEGAEHQRLRRLVAPSFSPREAEAMRPRIAAIVERLLDEAVRDQEVDLLRDFATPLPMEVICELIGVPPADRPRWRVYGAAVAGGDGKAFAEAIPAIIDDAAKVGARFGGELTETERVTLVWHLVLAGQVPANLIANAVAALLEHPAQLAELRAVPALMPQAVEELTRWCGPQLLTIPRYAQQDVHLDGVPIPKGDPVTVSILSANRDPRVFDDPDALDLRRVATGHLGYAHGPHFCLGAPLARVQTELALSAVLRRFPDLAPAPGEEVRRLPDPGTWRLASLRVVG